MDVVDYLKILRRRWKIIAAAFLIGLLVALVTLPPAPKKVVTSSGSVTAATSFQAATILLQTRTGATTVPLETIPAFVRTGQVPQRAAKTLDYEGDLAALAAQVTSLPSTQTETLTIVAVDPDPDRAVAISAAFSNALVAVLRDRAQEATQNKIGLLERVLADYQDRRNGITGGSSLEEAQRDALQRAYDAVQSQVVQLQVDSAVAGFDLQILQEGTATPAGTPIAAETPVDSGSSKGGKNATTEEPAVSDTQAASNPLSGNRWIRFGLIVGMATLLGAALALAIERFDTRMRGRKAFEETLLLPVVASVPPLSRAARGRHEITSLQYPLGGVAEAYRSLRSALSLLPSRAIPSDPLNVFALGTHEAEAEPVNDPRVILFTSPRARDGKTTSLVNLATALVEVGRRVVVLDCDFRNPEAHRFLEVPDGKGLSDLLADGRQHPLSTILQPTAVPAVELALAGASTAHPGALLGQMGDLVADARRRADVVLVDAPPLLVANDAIDLMAFVDTVVVCVREGRTTQSEGQQTAALLSRLRVACLGLVLVGATDSGAAYFQRGESVRSRLGRRLPSSEQLLVPFTTGSHTGGKRER